MKNSNHSCSSCENKNCFIQKLSPSWLHLVDTKKYTTAYPARNKVFMENEEVRGIFFIKKGKVKVFSIGINGNEKIFRLAGDGHILGHRGCGAKEYHVSATTLEDSIICFIDNNSFHELLMTNSAFAYAVMMSLSQELSRTELRAKCNAQMNAEERVTSAILYLKEVYGMDSITKFLNVALTRKEIAGIADVTPEVASRAVTQLETEKLIGREKRRLHIPDENKLYDKIKKYDTDFTINDNG